MSKFRILSLSGGGIRGLYTASFLAEIERLTSKRLVDHFDLLVGTSTGGLIALAIALGDDVESIRAFYRENGPRIFPTGGRVSRLLGKLRHVVRPKCDASVLECFVKQRFGTERTMADLRRPVVVTTFDGAGGVPVCIKTRHHPQFRRDHTRPLWEVAMATSAAPTYYQAFSHGGGTDFIDGGVWANCPVLVGVVEALARFGMQASEVDVLSVGTTRVPYQVPRSARAGGAWRNVSMLNPSVIALLMEANRAAALNMAKQLVGDKAVLEVDRVVPGRGYEMDDARDLALRDLEGLGREDAKKHVHEVESRFLGEAATVWVPIA